MAVSIDELLQSARSTIQKLNGLRADHSLLLSGNIPISKCSINKEYSANGIDLLMLGIEDASCTAQLIIQMQLHESDRQRTKMQVQRLSAENKWLREELNRCRERLIESEQDKIKLEVEIEHYKFKDQLERDNIDGSVSSESILQANPIDEDACCSIDQGSKSNQSSRLQSSRSSLYSNFSSSGYNSNTSTTVGDLYSNEITPKLKTLHNLVIHYASQHRYDVAVPLCRQTLEDLEKTTGRNHPDVATMLNILALVYRDQNKYQEASQLLKEALSIREQVLGPDNPAIAATLNNLSVIQGRRGKYKEAESLCNRALAIRISNLGHDHTDVAKQLVNLALICLNQGKYAETFSHYKKAIKIYSERLGRSDVVTLRTQIQFASALIRGSKYSESEYLLKDIISIMYENKSDNTHVDSQLLMNFCKAAVNLFKETQRTTLSNKLESMMNSGSNQLKEIIAILQNQFIGATQQSGDNDQ
ncbi:hypothetical protein GJ496_006510 [Pomphorhynchus laevis]|nr:hypothetical protein GJ496_006510 [Pomphorhynchus laevis]